MAVASMTGFARREGGDGTVTWTWEVKSVNARGLDLRARLPSGFESLEPVVRREVGQVCARGSINVTLSLDRGERATRLRVNRDLLAELAALGREVADGDAVLPPRLDGLLAVRGVVETEDAVESLQTRAAREAALAADLAPLMADLTEQRQAEGTRLKALVLEHLDGIAARIAEARESAEAQPEALRARLRRQVAELLDAGATLAEERLAQEAALLASKADVREELDRLAAHEAAARELLASGGAIGRRLDFLCQEFNREANTLCSKAQDIALTRTGLALKTGVEQLREQVQNIE